VYTHAYAPLFTSCGNPELRRDQAQVTLERRLPLVEDEPDAADGQDEDGELEPHATRIGSTGLFV
jgi:hypothetical protein